MKPFLSALALVFLLASCQGSGFRLEDDALFQQTIPVCQTEDECERVWQAARQWVMQATPQGLAVASDERIQTRAADDEALDWEADIIVRKLPAGDGKYRIVIETLCSTSINKCEHERRLMRRFNRDMARHVSSSQSAEILKVFDRGDDMDALFGGYATSLTHSDLRRHARRFYLPATVVDGGNVRQLRDIDEVVAFLEETRERLGAAGIARIVAADRQLLASAPHSAIVRLRWAFYDADDAPQGTQTATYNLVKVGKGWQIIFVSLER